MTKQSQPPVILLTRPLVQSLRFSAELGIALGDLAVVVSPLMQAEYLDPQVPARAFSAVIFASETAVAAANRLSNAPFLPRRAFCVGERTALAARAAGFETITVAGDAPSLVHSILIAAPPAPLLFLRGHDSTGQIAEKLNSAGTETVSLVIYRQIADDLSPQAIDLLLSGTPVILPLFSPRSARLMQAQCDRIALRSPVYLATLSAAVAEAAAGLPAKAVEIAARADSAAMVGAVTKLLTRVASP